MTIHLLSLTENDGKARARAGVTTEEACLSIEVRFDCPLGASRAEMWRKARDEVLRYLDLE